VENQITWKDFLRDEELVEAYQSSKACLIPYTGGSGRHPATAAMANATPVIASRAVDLPEYLGDLGIYVDGSGTSLARALVELDRDPMRVRDVGRRLRERAESQFSQERIAEEILQIYFAAL
jgi:glycosyltransferase involved in cell wall biosynthesis